MLGPSIPVTTRGRIFREAVVTARSETPGADRPRTARGNNPGRSRSHNRRVVLNLLRSMGALGRKELAEMTQLSTQAVANIIDELLAEGLLLDLGRRRSGRGQPPLQYAINPEGAMTIGMELSVTHLTVTVLDLGGVRRHESRTRIGDLPLEALVPMMAERVADLRRDLALPLLGVGLVMPGPFGIEGLSGVGPYNLPGWSAPAAAQALSEAIGVPVIVENDANAAAVGESLFGAGRSLPDFCLVYFGTGVGLGVITGGQPLRGANGNAGEIGHFIVVPDGRPCICGQSGCLERYASPHALQECLAATGRAADLASVEALHAGADPVLDGWITDAARHLSLVIAVLENIFDPETVILGGNLPDPVIDAILDRLAIGTSIASRAARRQPRVLRGQTGRLTAALGAAALPLYDAIMPRLDLAEPAGDAPEIPPSESA